MAKAGPAIMAKAKVVASIVRAIIEGLLQVPIVNQDPTHQAAVTRSGGRMVISENGENALVGR
jgi:hypothetical protein